MTTWTRDGSVVAYVEERLAKGIYRGIGEFHLGVGESSFVAPRRFADLAAEHDLILHPHTDAAASPAADAPLRCEGPRATPGSAPHRHHRRLPARSPNLWVELRSAQRAPGGRLDPSGPPSSRSTLTAS